MTCIMQVSLLVGDPLNGALAYLRVASTDLTMFFHALYDGIAAKERKSDPAFLETDARRSDNDIRIVVRRYSCGCCVRLSVMFN